MLRKVMVVVLALLAVASIAAPMLLGASDRDAYEEAVDSVLFEAELNNDRAEGAPQQQVVNGWTTRDLLMIQSNQINDLLELQSRLVMLLFVLVLLGAWAAVRQQPPQPDSDHGEPAPGTATRSVESEAEREN